MVAAGGTIIMAMGTPHITKEPTKTLAISTLLEIISMGVSHEVTMPTLGLRAIQILLQTTRRMHLSHHGFLHSSMVPIPGSILGWGQETPIRLRFNPML
jgi:hypothetical protein